MEEADFIAYTLSGMFYATKDVYILYQMIKSAVNKGYIRSDLLFKAFTKITKNDDRFAKILHCFIDSVIGDDFDAADVLLLMERISNNIVMKKYFPDKMISSVISAYPPSKESLKKIGMKSIMLFFDNADMVTYLEYASVNKIISIVRRLLSKKKLRCTIHRWIHLFENS